MADSNLFWELRKRYPEVPDFIVRKYMTQFGNDREKCIEMLTNESPKYLFGNQNCQVNDRLSELNLGEGEPRPRSDSSGSNMSNASSSSASSRPPYNTSHSLINVPGYRGPIIGTDDNHPPTAPIMPNEINQFMDMYRNDQNTAEIPNINCNNVQSVHHPYGTRTVQYGTNYGQSPSGNPVNISSSQQNLRQIEVQHIQTNREPGGVNPQSNYFQIRIAPNNSGLSSHVTRNNQSQPVTPNRGWVQHPVHYNSPYHNVVYPANQNTAFPSDLRTLPISQQQYNVNHTSAVTSPYKSPVEEQRNFGGYDQQYESQHSSQATIYLQNPAPPPNSQVSTMTRIERPMLSPGGQINTNIHSQYNDPGMSSNLIRNPSVNNSLASPKGLSGPVLVEIVQNPQRGLGVQSHIEYFNKIAGTPNSNQAGVSPQTVKKNVMLSHMTQPTENPMSDSHRHYTPERPTVINIKGAGTSRDDGGFLQFPPMPNECRVPGHPHGPIQKSASVDSNSVFVSDMEYRHISGQPFMSPASSHSSLCSESSAVRDRPRSGSLQDDPDYLKALLSHQKSRMDKLFEDLNVAEDRLLQLKTEVTDLESQVIERKRQKSSVFPSSVDLAKLRGDNLQLQADIQLMTREIDLFNNGQTPLGVLDPIEQQNFYKNMNTGQRGSIYGSASQLPPKTFTSTVTTSVTTTVTTPTRPPPEIPPQLPPRDPQPRDVPPPLPPRISANQVPPVPPQQPPVNSGDSDADGEQWSCSACTFLNHPALNKCECCEMPRMSLSTSASSLSPRDVPDSYPTTVQNTPST